MRCAAQRAHTRSILHVDRCDRHIDRGQHDVAAVTGDLVRVLVPHAREVVGEDHAAEAPLVAQDSIEQLGTSAGVLGADVVERAHDRVCATVLDADLEGTQVNLAHCLLVRPGRQHVRAVGLLVVEGEVLEEGVHTLGLRTLDLLGDLRARQDRVLREVLEVTTRVGVAVRVRGRRVPARDLHVVRHRADRVTEGTRELLVEGGRDGYGGGQADRADSREVVVQRGGAVHVGDAQLADRGDRR